MSLRKEAKDFCNSCSRWEHSQGQSRYPALTLCPPSSPPCPLLHRFCAVAMANSLSPGFYVRASISVWRTQRIRCQEVLPTRRIARIDTTPAPKIRIMNEAPKHVSLLSRILNYHLNFTTLLLTHMRQKNRCDILDNNILDKKGEKRVLFFSRSWRRCWVKFGVCSIRFGARSVSDSHSSSPVDYEPFLPLLFYRFSEHRVARENPVSFLRPSTLWKRIYLPSVFSNRNSRFTVTPRERTPLSGSWRDAGLLATRVRYATTSRACCVETVARAHARLNRTILERGVIWAKLEFEKRARATGNRPFYPTARFHHLYRWSQLAIASIDYLLRYICITEQ